MYDDVNSWKSLKQSALIKTFQSLRLNPLKQPDQSIHQTQCWLKTTIIGLNFCPFANKEFKNGSIRYSATDCSDLESALHILADEFSHLENNSATETSLLIFTHYAEDFNEFLDLIYFANQLLDDLGYSSSYQLAHFHPQYCFEGSKPNDAENYTNRSPWPTLHLLREQTLEQAIETYPDTAQIPQNNIELAQKLGADKLSSMLDSCKNKA